MYKLGRATPYGNQKAKKLPDNVNNKPKVQLLKENVEKAKKKLTQARGTSTRNLGRKKNTRNY